MKRYFSKPAVWPIVVGILGLLIALAGQGNTFGVLLLVLGGGIAALQRALPRPSDAAYDAWVESKLSGMEPRAKEKLGLRDPRQVVSARMRVDGFIAPTVDLLVKYGDVRFKNGKDGVTRFSINTVKYFYPTEHNLATYSNVVDALKQSLSLEQTDEFYYDDIVGAKTEEFSVEFIVAKTGLFGKQRTRRVQSKEFHLIASSGDKSTVTVGVTSDTKDGPKVLRLGDAIDRTVDSLRLVLRERKGGGQQAQAQQAQMNQQAQMQQQQQAAQTQQAMLEQMRMMQEQMMRMQQQGGGGGNSGSDGPSQS
ncbi:MAG: hypothetical protein IVW57_08975 [Ktedonobacterales bacterium]|nr:hypothetical protein [Ktedonobacterales bacterium]